MSRATKKTNIDYNTWSKEDLIDKIRKLEAHVQQLRNVISKADVDNPRKRPRHDDPNEHEGDDNVPEKGFTKKDKTLRKFDFSSVTMRHVALKILYLGWDYQGYAVQEDSNETIEAHLFNALTLTRLIEEREKSNYHRCGRTDKGVSAFCQVISIDLRSKIVDGQETMDYCKLLNKTLPDEIRVIGWSPVRPEFSARFNCNRRTYKYFFPRGNLNIQKMLEGAQNFVGEHDFRNFCKLDKAGRTTMRRIISVEIVANGENEYDMCHLVINGSSFIWHQIRCIVGVLLLIGQNLEEPDVVAKLLDVEKYPKKPQYTMATDYPLVLYDVDYPETEEVKWTYTSENMTSLLGDLQSLWMQSAIKSEMARNMVKDIENLTTNVGKNTMIDSLMFGSKPRVYVKLLDRPVCAY